MTASTFPSHRFQGPRRSQASTSSMLAFPYPVRYSLIEECKHKTNRSADFSDKLFNRMYFHIVADLLSHPQIILFLPRDGPQ